MELASVTVNMHSHNTKSSARFKFTTCTLSQKKVIELWKPYLYIIFREQNALQWRCDHFIYGTYKINMERDTCTV